MKTRPRFRIFVALLFCLVITPVLWLYIWLFYGLPSPDEFRAYVIANDVTNYEPVSLAEIPDELRWATIAAEDKNFYDHPTDINLHIILRVIGFNLHHDQSIADGYTITQRLAVNLMSVSGEPAGDSLRHRMRQSTLAMMIAQRYTKDEILEFYLNSVDYGHGNYGAGAASRFYYGKHIGDLDLAECATLVYISQLSDFDPSGDLEHAKYGQIRVLDSMVQAEYTSPEEAHSAIASPITFVHQ